VSLRPLRILGAGGHAKVVAEAWASRGGTVAAFHDDNESMRGGSLLGITISGDTASALESGDPLHIAIGSNDARRSLDAELAGAAFQSVVHATAWVSPTASVGDGTLVGAGAVLQGECRVGRHVIVNTAAVIEHDCVIGDFVHVAPGVRLGGNVEIGDGALVGIGSVILPGRRVGAKAVVGAGAVVIGDVEPGAVVVGNPARPVTPRAR
jgi:sugar O-acyltransferase (sialic acid O-acetyltransferase NeuD family)